jgi:hypothetical protein
VAHRDGYSFRLVRYDEVHGVAQSPRVRDVRVDGATLTLDASGLPGGLWLWDRGEAPSIERDGAPFTLPLESGRQSFRLRPENAISRAVEFSAVYVPGEPVVIGSTSIPFGGTAYYSLEDFAVPADAYSPEEREMASKVLDAAGLDQASTGLERIDRLASFLLRRLEAHRGRPSPNARLADGIQQYEMALAGETKVQCANFAEIYAAFANLAGIPTRVVDVRGEIGDVHLGDHTFNESYVQDGWMYVDLQLEVLHVASAGQHPVNGAQLLHVHDAGGEAGLEATVHRKGQIIRIPYAEARALVAQYLHPSATLNYHFADPRRFSLASRIHRHTLRPEPAYALGGSNSPLWGRVAAQIALIMTGCVWLVVWMRKGCGHAGENGLAGEEPGG